MHITVLNVCISRTFWSSVQNCHFSETVDAKGTNRQMRLVCYSIQVFLKVNLHNPVNISTEQFSRNNFCFGEEKKPR